MRISVSAFLASLIVAALWHDMASLLLKRSLPTSIPTSIKASLPRLNHLFKSQVPTTSHSHTFSTTANMATKGSATFLETIKNRRTYYGLKKESPISDTQIQEIIKEVILHAPSAFNSQSSRIVLLVKGEHDKLWDITKEILRGVVPAEQFASTEQRMDSFKAGYGTVRLPPPPLPFPIPFHADAITIGSVLYG